MKYLFVGLVLLAGCGPSIDPAAKADIDGRVAALKGSGQAFPAPTGFVPMPLAVGQWTQYKVINDRGEPSFFTHKIVGEQGGAFWLESVHEGYTGRTIQKVLVSFGNRTDPSQVEIRAIKTRDAKGRVNEIPPSVLAMMQSLYRSAVSMLSVTWQGAPQEAASVPAGAFQACYRVRAEVQWGGMFKSTSDSWSHPAVPLSGMVRSQGVDKPITMELVAFGLTGAQSEL
jgi:hypothetical protein